MYDRILFSMVIAFVVLENVNCLLCYECTESDQVYCGEYFSRNNVNVTDCSRSIYTADTIDQQYSCMFLKETDLTNNNSIYTRRCNAKNLNDTCEDIIQKNRNSTGRTIRTECRQCEEDFCNSSNVFVHQHICTIMA
ncbi:hypothetical protein ABEB36_006382, partial [Hypothenemus hampei]